MSDTPQIDPKNFVKFEDGIIWGHYYGDVTVEAILAQGEKSIQLLQDHKVAVAPLILVADPSVKLKLTPSNLAKVINIPIIKHISIAYVVGLNAAEHHVVALASKVFLNNRLILVNTMEEAIAGAQAHRGNTVPMLEQ